MFFKLRKKKGFKLPSNHQEQPSNHCKIRNSFYLALLKPALSILGLTVEKNLPNLIITTGADFSVLHTQSLGFTVHHPELIMLKKIKSYRDWSALKKCTTLNEKNK